MSALTDGRMISDGPYWRINPAYPSAKLAAERLTRIVAQDREACPAWRWVRSGGGIPTLAAPVLFGLASTVANGDPWIKVWAKATRKRFRWERRR